MPKGLQDFEFLELEVRVNPTVLCGPQAWSQYVNIHHWTSWVQFGLQKALQFQYHFSALYLNDFASSGSRIILLSKSRIGLECFFQERTHLLPPWCDQRVDGLMALTWKRGAAATRGGVVISTELDWKLVCLRNPVIQMFRFQGSVAGLLVPACVHYYFSLLFIL